MRYVIAGQAQPQFGEQTTYGERIHRLIGALGLESVVQFRQCYLSREEQIQEIRRADAVVFAYQTPWQSSSGVMPLVLAIGRPVVTTPISYALARRHLFGDALQISEDFSASSITAALVGVLGDLQRITECAARARNGSLACAWPVIGMEYRKELDRAAQRGQC